MERTAKLISTSPAAPPLTVFTFAAQAPGLTIGSAFGDLDLGVPGIRQGELGLGPHGI